MKLQQQFKKLKEKYPDSVVMIKSGIFYITYEKDAYILNYLLHYQINDCKVGFPKNALKKVLNTLKDNKISVYVNYDEINVLETDNQYEAILYKAKKNYYSELNDQVLLEEISFLIKSNPENLYKIKNFINEL